MEQDTTNDNETQKIIDQFKNLQVKSEAIQESIQVKQQELRKLNDQLQAIELQKQERAIRIKERAATTISRTPLARALSVKQDNAHSATRKQSREIQDIRKSQELVPGDRVRIANKVTPKGTRIVPQDRTATVQEVQDAKHQNNQITKVILLTDNGVRTWRSIKNVTKL